MPAFKIDDLERMYQECMQGSYEPSIVYLPLSCIHEIYVRDRDYRGWIEYNWANFMKPRNLPKLPT